MERARGQIVPNEFHKLLLEATPNPYVTPALVVTNVAYFAANVLFGANPLLPELSDLWRFGAIFGPLTFDGEWWRILTATFVHAGFLHLFFNMWALWSLGNLAERMFGNVAFLLIYVASGLGGSIGTLLWHPYVTSAGASGAIFGVLGALLAFAQFSRIEVPTEMTAELRRILVIVIGLSLAFGLIFPFIDNAAHVGGLIVGLVLGAALRRSLPDRRRSAMGLLAVPVTALALILAAYGSRSLAEESPRMRMAEGLYQYEQDHREAARQKFEEAIAADPDFWEAHLQLGLLAFEDADFQTAADALSRAIELDDDAAAYRHVLGLAYSQVDQLDKARAELDKALEESPDSPLVLSEVAIVQHRLGDETEAVASLRRAVELDPDNAEHHNRLALILAESGDRDGSVAQIEAALDLEPRAAHIWDSSGTVYFYREEWDSAIQSYRKAIQLDPELAIYHFNLSLALEASGDTKAAGEERARAFELDPNLEPRDDGAPLIWS